MAEYPALPEPTERLMREIIGCALAVHRELGPGYLERIYRQAMMIEPNARGLRFEAEKAIVVHCRGLAITGQRVDLVAGGEVVVELKAVGTIEAIHVAQVLSCLKTLELRAGLVVNFHAPLLKDGIRRLVRGGALPHLLFRVPRPPSSVLRSPFSVLGLPFP